MTASEAFIAPEAMTDAELAAVVLTIAASARPLARTYLAEAGRRLDAAPAGEQQLRTVLRGVTRARGDVS